MKIEIQDKIFSQTATNVGVNIQFVTETTANVNYSINDAAGNSIVSGNDTIDGGDATTIVDNLFQKLNIKRKDNEQPIDTTTSTPQP